VIAETLGFEIAAYGGGATGRELLAREQRVLAEYALDLGEGERAERQRLGPADISFQIEIVRLRLEALHIELVVAAAQPGDGEVQRRIALGDGLAVLQGGRIGERHRIIKHGGVRRHVAGDDVLRQILAIKAGGQRMAEPLAPSEGEDGAQTDDAAAADYG